MIKLAFALVALFYVCCSAPVTPARHDPNLNNEMINRLEELKNVVSLKPGFKLLIPGIKMQDNASACVITFIRELEKVLDNVTVPKHYERHLMELKANLKELESLQGNTNNTTNALCIMKKKTNLSLPLCQYINFIKSLNRSSTK